MTLGETPLGWLSEHIASRRCGVAEHVIPLPVFGVIAATLGEVHQRTGRPA